MFFTPPPQRDVEISSYLQPDDLAVRLLELDLGEKAVQVVHLLGVGHWVDGQSSAQLCALLCSGIPVFPQLKTVVLKPLGTGTRVNR